jgi:hypothetical protein
MTKPKVAAPALGLVKTGLPLVPRPPVRVALYDPPDAVAVDPGPPRTAAAADVFGPGELAARLEALAELHAAADPGFEPPQCWACGRYCPKGNQVATAGWRSRLLPGGCHVMEVYCARCYAEWGWPKAPGDAP